MTTLAEAKTDVLGLMQEAILTEDADGAEVTDVTGVESSAVLLRGGIRAALRKITSRVWKQSVQTLTITVDTTVFELPSDLINIEAVYDSYLKTFCSRMKLVASGEITVGSDGNAWIPYPNGSITFINALKANYGGIVYYSALWDEPTDESDVLEAPAYAYTAMLYYAASYCFLAKASGSSGIRQYAQKVDAGKPTDIPAKDMANVFLQRYENEMQSLPMTEKAIR